MKTMTVQDLHARLGQIPSKTLLLDVRTPEEFEDGHIEGSKNIDHEDVLDHVEQLRAYDEVIVYCRSGKRAGVACKALEGAGLGDKLVCIGTQGMMHWAEFGYPMTRS